MAEKEVGIVVMMREEDEQDESTEQRPYRLRRWSRQSRMGKVSARLDNVMSGEREL